MGFTPWGISPGVVRSFLRHTGCCSFWLKVWEIWLKATALPTTYTEIYTPMAIFSPRSREQKLVDILYPYFGQIAHAQRSDHKALEICQALIEDEATALTSHVMAPFLDAWSRDCPEEVDVKPAELTWALRSLESHISKQLYQIETGGTQNPVPTRSKLRVIQGGKTTPSAKVKALRSFTPDPALFPQT